MKILHIAYFTMKRCIKDPRTLASMLFLPLILILILGTSLSGIFESDSFFSVNIGVYSNDINSINEFSDYINRLGYKKSIVLHEVNSKEQGLQSVKTGTLTAFISIIKSKDNTEKIDLTVYKKDNICASVIKNITDAYKNRKVTLTKVNQKLFMNNFTSENFKPLRAIDYYSVTMLVMVVLYGSEIVIEILNEDLLMDAKYRVKSLPLKSLDNIIGKMLGIIFTIFIKVMFIVIFTKYIFKVNWGDNLIFIAIIFLGYAFFVVNLSMALFLIIKNRETCRFILNAFIPFSTLLSGGYVPINFFGASLTRLSILSPSNAVQNIIFTNIFPGYCDNVKIYYFELTIMLIIFCLIVLVLGRRSKRDSIYI